MSSCAGWSFLSDRFQQVEGQLSTPTSDKIGIGQGSILGPLFSVLFINDIGDRVDFWTTCKSFADELFANDVKLHTSFDWGSDPESLHASLT